MYLNLQVTIPLFHALIGSCSILLKWVISFYPLTVAYTSYYAMGITDRSTYI